MPVVVAEDGEDRDVEVAAGIGEHGRLVGLPVGGQISGKKDEIGIALQTSE
jgi:hypothetical protein